MTRIVLITGAGRGIGKGCHDYFQQKGWHVISVDLSFAHTPKALETQYQIDVSDSNQVEKMASEVSAQFKHIDSIIHAAAIQVEKTLCNTEIQEWHKVIDTNLTSLFLLAKYFTPMMNFGASLTTIGSVHSRATSPGMAAYVASKGAVSALSRAMALELGPNIRSNVILPGAIDTEMLRKGLMRSQDPAAAKKNLVNASPLKKIGSPEDIAKLAYFLSDTELSGNITGQEFVCDSGVLSRLASE